MRTLLPFGAALAICLHGSFCFGVYPDSVVITQLAMTGMPAPGVGGTFTSFSAPTADRGGYETGDEHWFIASTSNGNSAVYETYDNQYYDLADTTTVAPTGGNFSAFSNLSSGMGVVAFIATDTNGNQGAYTISYFPLALAATTTSVDQLGNPIGNIQHISISGYGYGFPNGIIQTATGVYSIFFGNSIAESWSLAPLTSVGPVSYSGLYNPNFNTPGLKDDATAFAADSGGVRGIYFAGSSHNTDYLNLASIGGAAPGGAGTFTGFGDPYVTDNEVAFTAHYTDSSNNDQQGVFVYGGYYGGGDPSYPPITLKQIVATGQAAPNSHGANFTGFSDISDTSSDTTFLASLSDGNEGLYINYTNNPGFLPSSQIVKIIETGDTLSGKIVNAIELAPDASNIYDATGDGGTFGIGFEANFTDGSEGIYYFTVSLPEPGMTLMVGVAGIGIFGKRRKRKDR